VDPSSVKSRRQPFTLRPPQAQQQRGGFARRERQQYHTVFPLAAKYNAVDTFK
jgi:hypothetical protein